MECGEEAYLCQLLSLISDNELAASAAAKLLGQAGEQANGVIGAVGAFLNQHAQDLFAAAAFAFALYRWWRYREHILHKRLKEYLQENDRRLEGGLTNVLSALQRPGATKPPKLPLFATDDMRSVLRERHWYNVPVAAAVASSAQWQLTSAVEKIERQLKSGEDMMSSLRKELATAHIMKGAIAASGNRYSTTGEVEPKLVALNAFRTALQIPGHEQSVVAKELEAHQLRRLGQFPQALEAYREVEKLAPRFDDYRSQRLAISRAKMYQAEMLQVIASRETVDGKREFDGALGAHNLVSGNSPQCALRIRARFAPYQGWELLEQGDLHYLTAFLAHNLDFVIVEPTQLDDTETAYRSILAAPVRRFRSRKGLSGLRARAEAGLENVQRARMKQEYQWQWLLPD